MDKVIQEFRIIETDDGFRIEIKGDKEQLREFVMSLDPRHWMHHGGGEWKGPFGGPRPWKMRFKRGGWGPFGWGSWGGWDDDNEDEDESTRRKRGHHSGHPHHEHGDEDMT